MRTKLLENVQRILGKPFEECHCSGLVGMVMPGWTERCVSEVSMNGLVPGDVVLFGERNEDVDALVEDRWTGSGVPAHVEERSDLSVTVGIYLGNGKVVVSTKQHGVCLIPFRYVRGKYARGFRIG